jgi:hypothetical protein
MSGLSSLRAVGLAQVALWKTLVLDKRFFAKYLICITYWRKKIPLSEVVR